MKKSRPDSSSRWLSMWAWVGISALGCSGGSEDSGTASLPPDSGTGSDNPDTGPGFFDVDTGPSGDTGLNESPPYDLRIEHTGAWERSPHHLASPLRGYQSWCSFSARVRSTPPGAA